MKKITLKEARALIKQYYILDNTAYIIRKKYIKKLGGWNKWMKAPIKEDPTRETMDKMNKIHDELQSYFQLGCEDCGDTHCLNMGGIRNVLNAIK